jgi:hypothetical protein
MAALSTVTWWHFNCVWSFFADALHAKGIMSPHCFCNTARHTLSCFRQEEGVILKNPESEWKPDDRRLGSWVKLKPEYTRNYEVHNALEGLVFSPSFVIHFVGTLFARSVTLPRPWCWGIILFMAPSVTLL